MSISITESDILSRVVEPKEGDLSPQAAKALIGLRFRDDQIVWMEQLAQKNRDTTITDAEREEMEKYSRVGHFLNMMQSKARQSLASQ